jgi:hypothetical protein
VTVASFTDIAKKIRHSIDQSKETIFISVAWFTNNDLLGSLIDKLEEGLKLEIIISDHFENQRLNFEKCIEKGATVHILPTKSGKFLHDKFALFDNSKLIAGSYNWTYSAEFFNHEFIIQSEDSRLIKQFNIRFENLKKIVTDYDKQKLISSDNLHSNIKEDEFTRLENELHDELLKSIELSILTGAHIDKNLILGLIYRYGAIGTANKLINEGTEKLHSGLLKLYEVNRLDLTIESIILKSNYRILFSNDILVKAQQRLNKLIS